MVKVRRKITILRVLQVVFYALGFPLFLHLVMLANKPLEDSYLAGNLTAYMAIVIAAVLWVVVILLQLLFRGICRKNRMARAVLVALFATVITLAPIAYSDIILKGKYEEIVEKYEEKGVSFKNYEKGITSAFYKETLVELNAGIEEYVETFNLDIDALEGKNFGRNGGEANIESKVVHDEEAQAYYSPNGMFSDGYLFSLKQAIAVQRAYYTNKLAYEAEGIDIDARLEEELERLENDKNSDWNKYKRGAAASTFKMEGFAYIDSEDEYDIAYGKDGYANKYFVTEDRLDAIVSVIGGKLGANKMINIILNAFKDSLPEDLDVAALLTPDLTVDQLIALVNSLGLGETLAGLLGKPEGTTEITKADLMKLLAGYSSYIAPTTYPIYYFIESESLREYAYANYYATVHGAMVGAILVGDKVGAVTLDSSGNDNPYSTSELLSMFDYWDAQTEMIEEVYPLIPVRNTALKMSAAIVFCLLATYWFAAKIDEQYAKLQLAK